MDLRRLGRMHSVAEAKAAFEVARATFDRVSFDLIYARQQQTRQEWRAELQEALSMAVDHLSLYQLTIEPGTAFGARAAAGKLRDLPDDDLSADMYLETQDICAADGMDGYETSNHARPGAESRHNLVYWRQGDWAAVGPGAHGRITVNGTRYATEAFMAPGEWLNAVERDGSAESLREALSYEEQATEYLLMSMRLAEGVDEARYANLAGKPLNENRISAVNRSWNGRTGPRSFAGKQGWSSGVECNPARVGGLRCGFCGLRLAPSPCWQELSGSCCRLCRRFPFCW